MTAGDTIVGTSGVNAVITFTPASGVEVIIECASLTAAASALRYTDANGGTIMAVANAHGFFVSGKVPTTNSLAIYMDAPGGGLTSSYGGIQTK